MRLKTLMALTAGLTILTPSVQAHEETQVASSPFMWNVKRDYPFGIRFSAGYGYDSYSAALNKEYQGDGKLAIVRDLKYHRTTQKLNLRMDMGFEGFTLFAQVPIVLSQQGEYRFQSGSLYPGYSGYDACMAQYPNEPWRCYPDGVNAANSRTVQEGIAGGLGFSDSPAPGESGRRSLFKGPKRQGLDQIFVGLRFQVPVFNEYLDPSKPNWVMTFKFGLPAPGSKIMDFKRNASGVVECGGGPCTDPASQRPDLNSGVGRGIYDFTFSTTFSKKNSLTDSFFHVYFTYPFAYTSDSLYSDRYDFSSDWGMNSPKAPARAGMRFGTDILLYQNDEDQVQINLLLSGRMDVIFEGRDYSEAYELLAGSPVLNFSCSGDNATTTLDHLCNGKTMNIMYYPGITTVENHAILGATVGLNMRLSSHFYIQGNYSLRHVTEHFVTYEDAGEDNPDTPGGTPGLVDLETNEMNPYYRPVIDQVGHRYRVQEGLWQSLYLSFSVIY